MVQLISGKRFSTECENIDVTSRSRPDTSWRVTDAAGHMHRWHNSEGPAEGYEPSVIYDIPTLRYIVDTEATGEYPERGHHECKECGATVEPGFCADMYRQFIPGLKSCYIDGVRVTHEEFERQLSMEQDKPEV